MPKFFISQEQQEKDKINIIGNDVKHIKNVLRKKIGETIVICNKESKKDYLCKIENIGNDFVGCKIEQELESNVESNVKVTIMQGLPKKDKMELIIQKSVELGVYEIIPVEMERCIVKLQEKDKLKKIERWQIISEVAAKQCGRDFIPKINQIVSLKNICNLLPEYDIVLLAYENEEKTGIKEVLKNIKDRFNGKNIKIAVIIGPEGGISPKEVEMLKENGAITISLGKRILRTETVALNVLSVIMYELEN